MSKLKVAVVGTGLIATAKHLPALRNLAKIIDLVAICDVNAEQAAKVGADFGVTRTYTDLATMLDRERPDIVDICTPSYLHFEQASAALRAGRHAIVEKPLAGSLAEVDRLVEIEAGSGKRVAPIFQYRFGNGLQKLKAAR